MENYIMPHRNSNAYKLSREACENPGKKIRTLHSGKQFGRLDFFDAVVAELKRLPVEFETGNDAPRGGLTGDYVMVKKVKGEIPY